MSMYGFAPYGILRGAARPFTFKMWKFGIKKRDLDNTAKELKGSIARKKERLCAADRTRGPGFVFPDLAD